MLAGCSKAPLGSDKPIVVSVKALPVTHPPLPAPLKLESPKWQACGSMVCMTIPDAKKLARNTVAVGRWVGGANNALTYYRGSGTQVRSP